MRVANILSVNNSLRRHHGDRHYKRNFQRATIVETRRNLCSIPHHIAIALLDLIRTEYLAGWL